MAASWLHRAFRLSYLTKRLNTAVPANTSAILRREFSINFEESQKAPEELEWDTKQVLQEETKENKSFERPFHLMQHDYFGVRKLVTLQTLFEKKVHFGHHKGTRNPYMIPYIFGTRFDQDIINLENTLPLLQDALNFIAHIAYKDGIILFISKNQIIMPKVEETARKIGEFAHCRHWHQGLFTDSANMFQFVTRLPDLCIFLNTLQNVFEPHPAIEESAKLLIPSVGIVDTNCDPRLISYPIPGNDDSILTQLYYLDLFKEVILIAKERRRQDDLKAGREDRNELS